MRLAGKTLAGSNDDGDNAAAGGDNSNKAVSRMMASPINLFELAKQSLSLRKVVGEKLGSSRNGIMWSPRNGW